MNRDINSVWDSCLSQIKAQVDPQQFKVWFAPIVPVGIANNDFTIQVPNKYFYEILDARYSGLIKKALSKVFGHDMVLLYKVITNEARVGVTTDKAASNDELPIKHIDNPWVIPGIQRPVVEPNLRSDYTLDTFIEGDCNQITRAAALAVAHKPGADSPFNPLFIHGNTGLGKTHLVQAIGNEILKLYPKKQVLYVNTNKFGNQIVHAIKQGKVQELILFYQYIDILIVDDINLLTKREKTQEIFFHIFNHLYHESKQLILTSDKMPGDLEDIDLRLITRFNCGLTTHLQLPDFETRMAIFEHKLAQRRISLPPELIELVAHSVTTNVRDLEGIANKVSAIMTFGNKVINHHVMSEVIADYVKVMIPPMSIESIVKLTALHYKVDPTLIVGISRKQNVTLPRQIAMYLSRKLMPELPLKTIGAYFGRDHATVIYSYNVIKDLLLRDEALKAAISQIEYALKTVPTDK